MRKNLHHPVLTAILSLFLTTLVHSQDRFAYAITDVNQNTGNWTVLRKLNFQTGTYTDALLYGVNEKSIAFDATSKKQIDPKTFTNGGLQPFSTGVAALAYDKKNSRLYYTPMFIDQLRYVDLKTMNVYYVTDQPLAGQTNKNSDNAKVISRMVIAPDGYGYAITNDATSFIRFSTSKKLIVEQLGSLVDDPANTGISVHNGCSSWGGDIIADDEGNLYLFSASNNVFKINTQTKVATWLGPIKGLPAGFTTNGVVVTDDGNLLAGSQAFSKNWYVINPKSWQASPFSTPNGVYLTSDLANSNYLSNRTKTTEIATIPQQDLNDGNVAQLYPNPISITDNQFKIQFNKLKAGDYTLEVTDVTGKQVMTQKLNVVSPGQITTISLKPITGQGIYLVKIRNGENKSVFTQKLVVQ
jgi:hypothetical protein